MRQRCCQTTRIRPIRRPGFRINSPEMWASKSQFIARRVSSCERCASGSKRRDSTPASITRRIGMVAIRAENSSLVVYIFIHSRQATIRQPARCLYESSRHTPCAATCTRITEQRSLTITAKSASLEVSQSMIMAGLYHNLLDCDLQITLRCHECQSLGSTPRNPNRYQSGEAPTVVINAISKKAIACSRETDGKPSRK